MRGGSAAGPANGGASGALVSWAASGEYYYFMGDEANSREFQFLPLTIGLETLGGVSTPLVLRGTPLPAQRTETFSTAADDQTSVEIQVFIGESAIVKRNLKLGSFRMGEIPPEKRGIPQIEVSFEVTRTCEVIARSRISGTSTVAETRLNVPRQLSDSVIAQMLADAEAGKAEDDRRLQHLEAVAEADRVIAEASQALEKASNAKLNEAVAKLGLALQTDEVAAIKKQTETVKAALPNPGGRHQEANRNRESGFAKSIYGFSCGSSFRGIGWRKTPASSFEGHDYAIP
jgi:molecular chaperone DnaK